MGGEPYLGGGKPYFNSLMNSVPFNNFLKMEDEKMRNGFAGFH